MDFNYKDSVIVRHLAGSHAYGTNIETSDVDVRGIFVAPEHYVRTPFYNVREVDVTEEEDTKLFELSNFMKLYMDMNPNIVETLWVHEDDIQTSTEVYDHLRSYAPQLLSKKAAFTFSGYAVSQLKRIKGHNKWINNPQSVEPPRQIDHVSLVHNFTDEKMFKLDMMDIHDGYRLIPYGGDLYGVYEASGYQTFDHEFTLNTNSDGDLSGFYTKDPTFREKIAGFVLSREDFGTRKLPLFIVKFNRDVYKQHKETHRNYWKWKEERNEARSALEEQFGYDTKHAMHLVRLLRMAEEILTSGVVNVRRPDAAELLAIRDGHMSYEDLVAYAEGRDEAIRGHLYKSSFLPKTPDIKLATQVLMECQEMAWDKPTAVGNFEGSVDLTAVLNNRKRK